MLCRAVLCYVTLHCVVMKLNAVVIAAQPFQFHRHMPLNVAYTHSASMPCPNTLHVLHAMLSGLHSTGGAHVGDLGTAAVEKIKGGG